MSRAFMVAGSRSVLVSLWSVDSLATEALMVDFYRRMSQGESPAAALRKAKLAVRDGNALGAPTEATTPDPATASPKKKRKREADADQAASPPPAEPRREHPYYWGAFILVGG